LAGEAIPLESRITAIADVFDALTSRRPYKPAFEESKALSIIAESVGTHFDPRVHQAFERVLPDLRNIRMQLRDHLNNPQLEDVRHAPDSVCRR
jgi:putative two-component system response regulator